MQALKKFMTRLERLMMAATFAEAGCWDTARQVMDEEKRHARRHTRPKVSASNNQRPTLHM